MSNKIVKIAIPKEGRKGLEDVVSNVFGRAKTFTIISMSGKQVETVEIKENPAVLYKHGAGLIVTKTLADIGVIKVMAGVLDLGT